MEALMFLLNSVIMVAMVVMGLIDDKRPRGTPATSLFRFRNTADSPSTRPRRPEPIRR